MDFQQKLEQLLIENNISKYRLAKNIGVSQSTIDNWVKGKTKPHFNYIKQIADYFSVTQECLLDDNINGVIYVIKSKEQPPEQTVSKHRAKIYDIPEEKLPRITSKELQKLISIYNELSEDDKTILMGEALKLQKAANKQEYITEVAARGDSEKKVKIKKSDVEKDLENYIPPEEL